MFLVPLVVLLSAFAPSGQPCSALRAAADDEFAQGRFEAAARSYREVLDRCPSVPASSKAAPEASDIVSAGPGVTQPSLLSLGRASQARSGVVEPLVLTLVSASGSVRDARVVRSSGDAKLDSEVQSLMRQAKFTPAVAEGKAVSMWLVVPVPLAGR